jgi:DUF2075 family protein
MPIAYLKTKAEFLRDAPDIEDVLREAVETNLGRRTPIGPTGEYASWQQSLGRAMFHLLNDPLIPDDAGIAFEFRLVGRDLRIDVMISGLDAEGVVHVLVIELKQWSDGTFQESPLEDHVEVHRSGRLTQQEHPSAQALDYVYYLEDFYSVVEDVGMKIQGCSYLHNLRDPQPLIDAARPDTLAAAPLFTKGDDDLFRRFIADRVSAGDNGAAVRELEESRISPSKGLAVRLTEMLKGNPHFRLMGKQRTAAAEIRRLIKESGREGRRVLIVNGGPGTGKSVIALQLLGEMLKEGRNARYVTKNAAPRSVFSEQLRGDKAPASVKGLMVSSDAFHALDEEFFDLLLVDEAHRLVHKSGLYRNLGDNQVAEIMDASKVSVFFLDESQAVTWRDMGTRQEIRECAALLGIPVAEVDLEMQFRCLGADDYLDWIDTILGVSTEESSVLFTGDYDVRVIDSPDELKRLIDAKNRQGRSDSRILAGYCWNWVSKKDPSVDDIAFDGFDFSMKWNLEAHGQGWMAKPEGTEQVGCVFTVQGLEGPYMGVIIGPDLIFRDGRLITDPFARASTDRQSLWGWKAALEADRDAALSRAERIIKNQYRVLLSRGMKGTYIYCSDPETQEFFKREIELARAVGTDAEVS